MVHQHAYAVRLSSAGSQRYQGAERKSEFVSTNKTKKNPMKDLVHHQSAAGRRSHGSFSSFIILTVFLSLVAGPTIPSALGFVSYQVLVNFGTPMSPGLLPRGNLVEGSDGALYGMTTFVASGGDFGSIFKVNKDGSGFTVLHNFEGGQDGAGPNGLMRGRDGVLYGTTGGANTDTPGGTVFKIHEDGSGYEVLKRFVGSADVYPDGAGPSGRLVYGSDGVLYGATSGGGLYHAGTIFKINTDGSGFLVLHSLNDSLPNPEGFDPSGGVLEGSDGSLYGTAHLGGLAPNGTLFKLQKDGSGFRVLWYFDGYYPGPSSLIQGSDGALYGTTTGIDGAPEPNSLFKIQLDGSGYTLLGALMPDDGLAPGALIQGSDGELYDTAGIGGSSWHTDPVLYGSGTIFRMRTDGTGFQVLKNFNPSSATNPPDGETPYAGLVQASDGAFYGTTGFGGSAGNGVLFKLVPRTIIITVRIPDLTKLLAAAFSYVIPVGTFTDSDTNQTLTYTASGMPPGITFDASTRTFSGTPSAVGGTYTVTITATDSSDPPATNSVSFNLAVQYEPVGFSSGGNPGHVILPPIKVDGSSVFKQGSTVPAKFMVFDGNGNSIGTPGLVKSFKLVKITTGGVDHVVNQDVASTTPDKVIRWDPTARQWVFNISTRSLTPLSTYFYQINLNDDTVINFGFSLK
jgi:uncharacterized repeat protein (TIGR03803 family)